MDGSAKINIAKENFTGTFFSKASPQVLARVRAIQLFLALFRIGNVDLDEYEFMI